MDLSKSARVPAPIKVIGVGGGGCNAIRRMLQKPTPGVEYIVCNTDIKSLDSVPQGVMSVQIGEHLTHGFGAGGDYRVGDRRLRPEVDNLIIIHNDRLLQFVEQNSPTGHAFAIADEAVSEGILAVSELVNVPGEINVDLADVKAVMSIPGGALMAIGRGEGSRYPAMEAAEQAVSNPLLDIDIKGSKGILFNFSGGPDLTLGEVNDAANLISRQVDSGAIMFFGMSTPKEELKGNVKLTLIATGIHPPLPNNWLSEMGDTIKEMVSGHRK
ncbi:MAG: cell division protein FtsZ [Chloroflexi bacterium]|nr:cell division protein FtsZ [Chloroflexota bacterium]